MFDKAFALDSDPPSQAPEMSAVAKHASSPTNEDSPSKKPAFRSNINNVTIPSKKDQHDDTNMKKASITEIKEAANQIASIKTNYQNNVNKAPVISTTTATDSAFQGPKPH
jgi:hypothetical protein